MWKGRIIFGISKVLIVLAVLLLMGCEEDKTNLVYELNKPDDLPADVYEVYSMIIDNQFSAQEYILLQQETDSSVHEEHCYRLYENQTTDLDTGTIGHYLRNNHESYNLDTDFDADIQVKLITNEELKSYGLNSHKGWDSFHKNYPGARGVLYFTLPGFNDSATKGLFEYTWHSGMDESEHYMVYLKKTEGEWHMMVHEKIDVH